MWEAAREEERKIPWKEANEGPLVPEEQKRFWRRRVDAGLLSEVEMARAWTKTQQCISSPCTNRLHYSHSDFNKTTKQTIGPPADTVMVTSSGITAREPQQNPVLVFSITLTQKRVRPPVWIILVLHAELSRAIQGLCQRPLSLQPPIHSRTCVRCTFPVACTHTNKIRKIQMKILTNTYRRRAHAHTHTHTQTPTQEHMHTTPSES